MLAIFVALLPPPDSVYGVTLKATTLALLMSGIVLGEGFACVVFSAPLFYLVALVVTAIVVWIRKSRDRRTQVLGCVALAPLVLASVEGTHPSLSFPRHEAVTAERLVEVPAASVRASLAATPSFERVPWVLRIGFPQPVAAEGEGLAVGDRRAVHFAGGEGAPGTLEVEVRDVGPDHVVFGFPEDGSHIAHWLRWQSAELRWQAEDEGRTRVRFTLRYERLLDPAWYFGPIERVFVERTADYLIEALAEAS
jgi:hypothetical protein